jgi:hypothetical protein
MSIKFCKKTRRQFLQGTGKSLLALPLLPSLLTKEAFAQTVTVPKRLMMFYMDHGNLNELWPAKNLATQSVGGSGAREVLMRNIGNNLAVSPVFRNARYASLITNNQVSMLRGFDTAIAYGPAHGNFSLACAEGRNSEGNFPTIDSVLEASSTLYPSTTTAANVRKAIRASLGGGGLFYEKVGDRIQGLPTYERYTLPNFYNEVFGSLTGGTVPPQDLTNQFKSNILNRVHSSFASFRGNRRISSDDRARLTQHMDYISDIQRSFASLVPPAGNSCSSPTEPPESARNNSLQATRAYLDLMAVAFKCGLTKVGAFAFDAHDPQWIPDLSFLNGQGFHGAVHGDFGAQNQQMALTNWWRYNADLIADRFLAPLDEQEGATGRTYLDNMVTTMVSAGGIHALGNDGGHNGLDSQQIMFGSMAGRLRAGRFMTMPESGGKRLPLNCYLLTLLNLMGIPQSEYASATANGQGFGFYGGFGSNHPFASRFYQPVNEILV